MGYRVYVFGSLKRSFGADGSCRKLAALVALLLAAGMAVVAAQQRIFTNPKPEGQLRRLFPGAVTFSPLGGTPLHFKVYASNPPSNPAARLIGLAFWTTDLVPREYGYRGPIHVLVGMDTAGVLIGVVVDYSPDPYGYFSVDSPAFAAQFAGKSIRDPFRVGVDIDAISRATISITSATRAIRDSSRLMARQFLTPDAVK